MAGGWNSSLELARRSVCARELAATVTSYEHDLVCGCRRGLQALIAASKEFFFFCLAIQMPEG